MKRLTLLSLSVSLSLVVIACGGDKKSSSGSDGDATDVIPSDVDETPDGDGSTEPEPEPGDVVDPEPDAGPDGEVQPEPEPECTDLQVDLFLVGKNGQIAETAGVCTVLPADEPDAYNTQDFPGLQLDVSIETSCVPSGTNAAVKVKGLTTANATVIAVGDEGSASAKFVTVPPSPEDPYPICVEIDLGTGQPLSDCKDVIVLTEACDVSITQPPASSGCLDASIDADPATPGTQMAFTVQSATDNTCLTASLDVSVGGGTPTSMPAQPFSSGSTTFVVTVAEEGVAVEGLDNIAVTATAHHTSTTSLDGVVNGLYTLDNSAPIITVSLPAEGTTELNLLDDKNTNEPGIQYDFTGTVVGLDSLLANNMSLWIDDVEVAKTNPNAGTWEFDDITLTQNGVVAIKITATDDCGNTGETALPGAFSVFAGQLNAEITSPKSGTTLKAVNDGDPGTETTYEIDFTVVASGLVETLTVECREAGTTAWNPVAVVDTAVDPGTGGVWTIPVALDTTTLTDELECRALADGPNPATSPTLTLTVGLPAPSLTVTSPAEGTKLNSKFVTITGEATGLDGKGVTVEVFLEGSLACTINTPSNIVAGVMTAKVDIEDDCLVPLPDGTYFFQVDATDDYGNTVSELQEAPGVTLHFDTAKPELAVLAPADAVLDPVGVPAHADQDPIKPGYQTDIVIAMNGETDAAGAEICISLNSEPELCEDVDAVSFQVSWPDITLNPGANTLDVSGTDGFGNVALPVSQAYDLQLDAPIITITDPGTNIITAATEYVVTISVTDNESGEALSEVDSATLLVNEADSGLGFTANGDGTFTFDTLTLTEGAVTTLQATATFSGQEGASGERTITQKDVQPTISITNLDDGAVFNTSSAECLGAQADCVLDISVTTSDAEAGSQLFLDVLCGDAAAPATSTASLDPPDHTFPQVTLEHGGACAVTPRVIDAAGQERSGQEITVTVDRVGPAINEFINPSGTKLLHVDDKKPATEGMQHALVVQVSGVEAGQLVNVSMNWTDPDLGAQSKVFTPHEVLEDVGEEATYSASFEDPVGSGLITYPEGTVNLTAAVVDAAGNPASLAKSVLVETNAPSVQITLPEFLGDDPCNADSDCEGGVCEDGVCWDAFGAADTKQLKLNVAGLLTDTGNVRICSDHPDVEALGGACETAGYFVAATTSLAEGSTFLVIDELPEDFQTLIAEALPEVGEAWVSSLNEVTPSQRYRRIYVDETVPSVDAIEILSDILPPSGFLNAAEANAGTGTFDIKVTGSEPGQVDLIVNELSKGVDGLDAVSFAATFSVLLSDGNTDITAQVIDRAGNSSSLAGAESAFTVVDTAIPSIDITTPSAATTQIKKGDSLDVVVNTDEDGATVALFDDGVKLGNDTIAATGSVTYADILGEGSHQLSATATDTAGNSSATSVQSVFVDTVDPIVALTAPANGAQLFDAEDADLEKSGYQVEVIFTTDLDAIHWTLEMAGNCNESYAECDAPSVVTDADVTVGGGGAEPTQLIDVPLSLAISNWVVTMTVIDEVGNSHSDSRGFTITAGGCIVGFSDLPGGTYMNPSVCTDGCDPGGEPFDVAVSIAACGTIDELVLFDGDDQLDSILAPGASETFQITLVDGETLNLRLEAIASGTVLADAIALAKTVDFTAPQVDLQVTAVGNFTTPDDGATVIYNKDSDADGSTAGFQGALSIDVTDANLSGGGQIDSVLAGAAPLTPSNTSLPASFSTDGTVNTVLSGLNYPDQAASLITISATDAAGNTSTTTFTADVDIQPPSAVLLADITSEHVNPRLPAVQLGWNAVGDNGSSEGTADQYDIRYSKSSIDDEADFDAACSVSLLEHSSAVPSPKAAGEAETYTVAGPSTAEAGELCKLAPTQTATTWYFAARVTDSHGNWSSLSGGSVKSTDLIGLQVLTITSNLGAFSTIYVDSLGDVSGDGGNDLSFGSHFGGGACVVYAGSLDSDLAITGLDGTGYNCITDAEAVAGSGAKELGTKLQALGDVNGDGRNDLGISGTLDNLGFVAVYLGKSGGQKVDFDTPHVLITGLEKLGKGYVQWGSAGNLLEVTGSEGTDDIALGEPASDRVRVVPGDKSWASSSTSTVTIDLTDGADVAAFKVLTIEADFGPAVSFGQAASTAGDVLPTPDGGTSGLADLLVRTKPDETDSSVVIIPGRDISGALSVTVSGHQGELTAEDELGLHLRQDLPATFLFGATLLGGQDLTGDGIADPAISHGSSNENGKGLYVFDGAQLGSKLGTIVRVNAGPEKVGDAFVGEGGFIVGANVDLEGRAATLIGDWDGWTFGESSTVDFAYIVGDGNYGDGIIRLNHEGESTGYELGLFPVTDVQLTAKDSAGSQFSFGPTLAGGHDLTGDGRPDLVVGTGAGKVLVIK